MTFPLRQDEGLISFWVDGLAVEKGSTDDSDS